jgi:hypothetical protein
MTTSVPTRGSGTTGPTLYLLDVDDVIDEGILRQWVADTDPSADAIVIPHPRADNAATQINTLVDRPGAGDVCPAPLREWPPPEQTLGTARSASATVRAIRAPARPPQAPDPASATRGACAPRWWSRLLSSCSPLPRRRVATCAARMFVARQALKALER